MAKIKKIKEGTATVYPATIPQAVIDPTSGKSVRTELNELKTIISEGNNWVGVVIDPTLSSSEPAPKSTVTGIIILKLNNGNTLTSPDFFGKFHDLLVNIRLLFFEFVSFIAFFGF